MINREKNRRNLVQAATALRRHTELAIATCAFVMISGCAARSNKPDHLNNQPRVEDAVVETETGKLELYEEKYDDGTIKLRVEGLRFNDDDYVRHGPTTVYWDNGQKKTEIHFVQGLRHGSKTSWYKGGQIWSYGEYVNDREHGMWTQWFPNGRKAGEKHYEHGAWHGLFTEWHTNGKKKSEVLWIKGKKQGTMTIWDEEGELFKTIEYVDGVAQP